MGKLVDYRIMGDTFSVKIECPTKMYELVEEIIEEFADKMFEVEESMLEDVQEGVQEDV